MTDDQEKKDLLQSYWDALDALDEIFDAMVEAHENGEQPALVRDEAAWIEIPRATVTVKEFVAAYAALIRAYDALYTLMRQKKIVREKGLRRGANGRLRYGDVYRLPILTNSERNSK